MESDHGESLSLVGDMRTNMKIKLPPEGHAFRCAICGSEPNRLVRVRLQEWGRGGSPICRRLLCVDCFDVFDTAPGWASCVALCRDGREWCLRCVSGVKPVTYTRGQWTRYVARKLWQQPVVVLGLNP